MMEQICLPHRLTADKRLRPKLSSATSFIRKTLCAMFNDKIKYGKNT